MKEPTVLFKKAVSINNKSDPADLVNEDGVQELPVGVNIDISDNGRVERRKGTVQTLAGDFHSLYPAHSEYLLCVSGTDLMVLESDLVTTTSIRTVTENARLSCVRYGDKCYYANGYELGYVEDRVHVAWEAGTYVGPTTTKTFANPPLGSLLEVHGGRMLIAQGNVVWYSQPFWFGGFNLAANYLLLHSNVTAMKSVTEGVFISDESTTYFFKGKDIKSAEMEVAYDDSIVQGSVCRDTIMASEALNLQTGTITYWATGKGFCLGTDSGKVINLTQARIKLPSVLRGCILARDKHILLLLEP